MYGSSVSWVDYDNDGDLDLYVLRNGANAMYRNDGGGTYTPITTGPLADAGYGLEHAWFDYDNDGDLDLYIVNYGGTNRLLRNDGGGNFTDVTYGPLADAAGQGQGVAVGDYDNDGRLDLFIVNLGNSNRLLHNDGNGVFSDVTPAVLATTGTGRRGALWGDYDNDGDLDLFVVTSSYNILFRNDGGGTFVNDSSAPMGTPGLSAVSGDYDGDGDQDIYVVNYNQANQMLRNDQATGNHWLEVRLVGTLSNAASIGARIRVVAGGVSRIREIAPAAGKCQTSLTAQFGLGAATTVDSVIVEWPSGVRRVVAPGPTVNQKVEIVEPRVQMTNVATGTLADNAVSNGAVWVDYDGDGDLDLFFGNDSQPNRLMRNDGNFAFTDVTPAGIQDAAAAARTAAWGDYDNDGDPDLYLANYPPVPNKLFRNDGNGVFTDLTAKNPVVGVIASSKGAYWVDFDNDGDLDLSVVGYNGNFLFRNDGPDEPFADVSSAIPATVWNVEAAAWADFDNDGDMDLYLGRDNFPNRLVVNDGGGAFHDASIAVIQDAGLARGVAWGDYDNDGDLDLALATAAGPVQLYRNDNGVGAGFTDVSAFLPPSQAVSYGAINWVDVNLDGRLDLVSEGTGGTQVFVNLPGGFAAETIATGVGVSYGTTIGDADRDGAPDVYSARNGANTLLRNTPIGHPHWLVLTLQGTASNRSAVGARVRVYTGATTQMREIEAGSGYQSQDALEAMFGLGSAAVVDSIWIQWPSGTRQRLANVAADQYLNVNEMRLDASDGEFENRVELSWTAAENANYYFVLRRDDDPNDATPPVLLSYVSAGDSTYSDDTAVPDVQYTYTIEKYQLPSRTLVATAADQGSKTFFAPTDFQASVGTQSDRVTVQWLDNSYIESGYELTRTPSVFTASGAVDTIPAPPSIAPDALEDSTVAYLFRERLDTALASDLAVDNVATGIFAGDAGTPGSVPAGTVVTSYMLHSDRVAGATNTTYSGMVTFDTPILGLIFTDAALDNSDALLGSPTTTYPTSGLANRGTASGDAFALSADRLTLTFTLHTPVRDEMRIVVAGGGLTATLAPNVSSYKDQAAIPGVDYTYCLRGFVDAPDAGDTTRVWTAQFCTGGRRATILPPGDVIASDGQDSTAVVINWVDRTTDEQGFWIYRDGTKIGFVPPDSTRYRDTQLLNATHTYCVQTVKDSTAGMLSDQVCDQGIGGLQSMAAPLTFTATDSTFDDRVDLSWRDTAHEDEFLIYRGGELLAVLGRDVVTFSDRTATPGLRQGYEVVAAALEDTTLGYAGGTSAAVADSGFRSLVVAPSQVAASDGEFEDHVEVTWSSISTTAVLFTLYRDGDPIRTVPGYQKSATDDDVDTAHHAYSVTAVTAAGIESEQSFAPDSGARAIQPPGSVKATDDDYENQVIVTWTDASKIEAGYRVWRKVAGASTDSVAIGTAAENRTTYVDVTGAPGVTYAYSVSAFDALGASAARTDYGRRSLEQPQDVTASQGDYEARIRITWSDKSRYEDGYYVYRRITGDVADSVRVDSLGANTLAYEDDGSKQPLVLGTHYTYYVVAFDVYGASRAGSAEGFTRIMAPASVSVSDAYSGQFVVSWVDRSQIETGYKIYRDGALVHTTLADTTTWTDTNVSGSLTPTYCVEAICATDVSAQVCDQGALGGTGTVAVGGVTMGGAIEGAGTIIPAVSASSTFGWAVSMGKTRALVSDPYATTPTDPNTNNGNAGAVFPFERVNGTWKRSGDPLYPPSSPNTNGSPGPAGDSPPWFAGFGMSVAMNDDDQYAVVGDNSAQASGFYGRAFVYGSSSGSWILLDTLEGVGGSTESEFGAEVEMSGRTILVGTAGGAAKAGKTASVYLFDRVPATGKWQAGRILLSPGNGDGTFGLTHAFSGGAGWDPNAVGQHRMAIDGNVAVVAGDDLLYVFERNAVSGLWGSTPTQILNPAIGQDAVAVSGNTIVVMQAWSAEVWERKDTASSWGRTATLRISGDPYNFGDVAVKNGLVVLGTQPSTSPQATLVFSKVGGSWVQVADIRPPTSEIFTGNHLGYDIDLDDDDLMIGGPISGNLLTPLANVNGKLWVEKLPALPTGITGSDAAYANKIQVRWTDNSVTEDGFKVYRDGDLIGTTGPDVQSYDDGDVEPGRTYEYWVTSFTSGGYESGYVETDYGRTKPNGTIGGRVATNAGSGVSGVTVELDPAANNALLFDGIGGYLLTKGFAIPDTFTVDLWVNPRPGATASLLSKSDGASNLFGIRLTADGHVEVRSGASTVATTGALARDQWQHLAVVAAFPTIKVYRDGGSLETLSLAATTDTKPADGWAIGARWNGSAASEFFGGRLDEVRIWDRALTQSEIQADRLAKRTGAEQDLLAYWPLDQFDEPAMEDLSPNQLYAKTVGGVHWSAESAPLETFAVTDDQGNYTLKGLRYGTGTDFIVRPVDSQRDFGPEFKTITLNPQTPVQNEVAFNDITSHTISGTIVYAGTDCPAPNVTILVDGTPQGATDKGGRFAVAVDQGPHQIAPQLDGHTFSPQLYNFFASADSAGFEFSDLTTRTLAGRVGGRCPGVSVGTVTFEIASENLCFRDTVVTGTTYSETLPPGSYSIVVLGVTDIPADLNPVLVRQFFSQLGALDVDLTADSQTQDVVYTAPLKVAIEGWDPVTFTELVLPGGKHGALPDAVLDQTVGKDLQIKVYEDYGNGNLCPLDTADVVIYDEVIDNSDPVTVGLKNGVARYHTAANTPNVYAGRTDLGGHNRSYQKAFTVFVDVPGRDPVRQTDWVLVTGHRPRPSTFSTVAEGIPVLILRDPPGDHSYAYMDEGRTSCTVLDRVGLESLSTYQDFTVKIGARFSTGFGYLAQVTSENFVIGNLELGVSVTEDQHFQVCTTIRNRISTSADQTFIGHDADLYAAAGINFSFAKTDVIDAIVSGSTCTVEPSVSTAVGSNGVKTAFLYTEKHIRDHLIPEQLEIADGFHKANDDADAMIWESSAANLQSWIARNDSLRKVAKLVENKSFSAGATEEYSKTTTTTKSYKTTVTVFTNDDVAAGYNFDIVGTGPDAKWGGRLKLEATVGTGSSTENSKTVGYVLSDDDIGDYFNVDVKDDPVYGTPVFDVSNVGTIGTSSCPYEPWYDPTTGAARSQPRDGVSIGLNPENQQGVPPDQPAVFTLRMTNSSPTDENREYVLFPIQTSNPGGAIIKVNGGQFAGGASFVLAPGDQEATLTVERGPRKYDYPDLKVAIAPACEIDNWRNGGDLQLADTVTFHVQFDAPCSDIDMLAPKPGWAVNASKDSVIIDLDNYTLSVGSTDATPNVVQAIGADYRRSNSDDTPTPIVSYTNTPEHPLDLLPKEYVWYPPSSLPDSSYDVMAWTQCNGTKFYVAQATGRIDRGAPQIAGFTPPDGGTLTLNGSISVKFSEDIDCSKVTASGATPNIKVERSSDLGSTWYPVILKTAQQNGVVCDGRTLTITPVSPRLDSLETQQLRVTVSGVKDVTGNALAADTSWTFLVQRNEFAWAPALVSKDVAAGQASSFQVSLVNGLTQDVDYELTGLPPWLAVPNATGSLNALETHDFVFEVADTLKLGTPYDTTIIATAYEPVTHNFIVASNLPVHLDVICGTPNWTVNPADYQYSMTVVADVEKGPLGDLPAALDDTVAAFVGNEVRGVAAPISTPSGNRAFLTIYGKFTAGERIRFKVYDNANCLTSDASPVVQFASQGNMGTVANPLAIATLNSVNTGEQMIPVEAGWNWFSLNRKANFADGMDVAEVLGNLNPLPGDQVKNHVEGYATYTDSVGWQPLGGLDSLDVRSTYLLHVSQAGVIRHRGNPVDIPTTPVPVDSGWTWIGYPLPRDTTLNDALDGLTKTTGDLIVGRDAFAQYDGTDWVGSLAAMKPGAGYKLYLQHVGAQDLVYPDQNAPMPLLIAGETPSAGAAPGVTPIGRRAGFGGTGAGITGGFTMTAPSSEGGDYTWTVDPRRYRYDMTVSAAVAFEDGRALNERFVVLAVVDGEVRGMAHLKPYSASGALGAFMMVYGNSTGGENVKFRVYDPNEQALYDVSGGVAFVADAAYGATGGLVAMEAGGTPEQLVRMPTELRLAGNFPNPFRAGMESTVIRFGLPAAERVSLKVFDLAGRNRATLVHGRMEAGWHDVAFDGARLSAGVYFYRLEAGGKAYSHKLLILR